MPLTNNSSGVEDPKWQTKFTIIWTSVLAFSTLISLPWVIRAARQRRLYSGLAIRECDTRPASEQPSTDVKPSSLPPPAKKISGPMASIYAVCQSAALFTLPMPNLTFWRSQVADCCRRSYFSLSVSQIVLVAAYLAAAIACWTVGADLIFNSNRAGYLALAQLPVVMLLSLKSPLPVPAFLPSLSYEHYNFLHRWAGRSIWLAVTVHMAAWLNQFISTGQWDQVWQTKSIRGMIAYAMLCMVALTSVKPFRRRFYQIFWIAQ